MIFGPLSFFRSEAFSNMANQLTINGKVVEVVQFLIKYLGIWLKRIALIGASRL